jgi:hypothetical protein
MLKNWIVKTQQVKKSSKGLSNYLNYLKDKNRSSHSGTKIVPLLNNAKNIFKSIDDRKLFRQENSLPGGGVRNFATSFVMSLPKDIKQPSDGDWNKIGLYAIKKLSEAVGVDYETLKEHSVIVLHDEKSHDKPSHLNIVVGNVINNEVVKGISQLKGTFAVKESFNYSVKKLLNEDNFNYMPKTKNVNKPLWKARQIKADAIESKLDLLEKKYNSLKKNIKIWSKDFLSNLIVYAKPSSKIVADEINDIDEISKPIATDFDKIIYDIENQNPSAPDETKVTPKRKRRRRNKLS